jgi:signal transduction histidine kinase
MIRFPRPLRALRNAYAQRLSWKLALSHLTVALICQAIYVVGAIAIIVLASGTLFTATPARDADSLPARSPEMSEETRILATLLSGQVQSQHSTDLSATLARLPPSDHSGYGAFDGLLSPTNRLVVVAPDGTVLASSDDEIPPGTPMWALAPPAWGAALDAALRGERDSRSPALTGRDPDLRVLVTAYPIIGERGEILGALGLRSARVPLPTPPPPDRSPSLLVVLASVSALVLGLLVVVGFISSVVSSVAGFLLARKFGRRLRPLAAATEAIARGDLTARVPASDRDEIGQLGERFNLLTARLDETERARRAFVSNISHELRTPLAIIRGHVEAELTRTAPGTPSREALETIDREAFALGSLIDDFFTLTRIEEAALPLQPAPVDIRATVADAIAGIRPLARAQGHIAVESVVPPDLPRALADPTRLGQILNNLLYNALRHTPDGGVIVVEAAVCPGDAAIELGVVDTGTGIAPDELPYIFDRFYRGERNGQRAGGSGLGLAIVKQLVEAQGGTVRAESVLGEGTSIRFTLPRAGRA